MKSFVKQSLLIVMMLFGMMGAFAQGSYVPTRQTDGTWTLTMPSGNRLLNVSWKADANLAWQIGGQAVPTEGVSGYVGFESNVTFPELVNPHNFTVAYSSTDETVATINNAGAITFVAAGTTTIKATFAGDNDYAPQVVSYTLTVETPPMLTLVANGNGTVTVEGAKRLVNLADLTSDYIAQDGDVLTGTLDVANHPVKISVAAGATVVLHNATINGVDNSSCRWAGITCIQGDATLILSGENTVKGYYHKNSGIYVGANYTLTLKGSGSLNASSNGDGGAGIGGGDGINCGNIVIEGGTITATGGTNAAGIGSGHSCGNISITGGIVNATGGDNAAGIGSSSNGSCGSISITGGTVNTTGGTNAAGIGSGQGHSCGDITITNDVTQVTATMGQGAINSIGRGYGGYCGTVSIGGVQYWGGWQYVGQVSEAYLAQSPLTYNGNGTGGGDNTNYLSVIELGNSTYSVYPGTNVNLVATYDAGYHFVNWKEGETMLGTNDSIVVTFGNENRTIEANFANNPTLTLAVNDPQMGSVDAIIGNHIVDLSTLTADYTAQNGDVLEGTLDVTNYPVKISIADGATVMLHNATILGKHDNYQWAGITCEGNASLILGGTNIVKGFNDFYPGIYVAENKTLTIQGDGSLDASSNGKGAGIGGGYGISCGNISITDGTVNAIGGQEAAGIGSGFRGGCGNISITGGTVTATGGEAAAGIGSGLYQSSCGTITITGGTITATGGAYAAGIGSGYYQSSCGTITITDGVAQVTATMGQGATNSFGRGNGGSCGTVSIGGTVYWDGTAYQNGGNNITTGLVQETYTYNGSGVNSNSVTYSVYPGTQVTVTATPVEHHHLASWTPTHILNTYDTAHVTVTTDTSLTAHFAINPTLTLDVNNDQMGGVELMEGGHLVDLSTVTTDYTAQDGDILTGTLDVGTVQHPVHPVKISVADGARVTLHNVTIDGLSDFHKDWAGITCLGDATLILEGTNSVKGFYSSYPGIYVPSSHTLTIQGSGSLNASSNGWAAGIGSGNVNSGNEQYCGNIVIAGGTITATGGNGSAGIGAGQIGSCGTITITGGTVNATGGNGSNNTKGAAIGSGDQASCGAITITDGVTQVTATKGSDATNSIGRGDDNSTCGTVTIGGTVYWDGSAYQNGGDNATTGIVQETYTYNGGSSTPAGNVTNLGNGSYRIYPGTNIFLAATYNPGYHFSSWKEGENTLGTDANLTMQVDADHTITAHFANNPVLTLDVNNAQMGYAAIESTPAFGALAKSFNCSSDYQYGVFTDGTYIYTSSWSTSISDGKIFHKYDADGTLIEAFNIDNLPPLRNITTDGTYFYGGGSNNDLNETPGNTIYIFDLSTKTKVGTIECPGAEIRHISYDSFRDGFWVGNWSTLALYDRNGNKLQDGPTVSNVSGSAYYHNGDEHLLLFRQPNGSGASTYGASVYDYNITSNSISSDPLIDCLTIPGTSSNYSYSSGCFIGMYNNQLCWFGDIQQSPNLIGIYPITTPTLPDGILANTDGTYNVYPGTQVTVTATLVEHHHLASWTPTHILNTYDTAHVTVTTDTSLTAHFAIDQHTVTAVVADNQSTMGTVSGTATVGYGTEVTLTAAYNPGYHFVKWTEGTTDYSTDASITVQATSDRTLTAHFAVNPTLTLDVNNDHMGGVELMEGGHLVDLATVTANYTAQNGDMLTGTLDATNYPIKISVAAGARVTLRNATIIGVDNDSYQWAGINCMGNATLVLSGANTVKGFDRTYPGIHVPQGSTLTIEGDGSLEASNNLSGGGIGGGAGIGGGSGLSCGNIVINGGNITTPIATLAAGIGGGPDAQCGDITITGGTINATGGSQAAGIGAGRQGSCGNITITGGTIHATGGTSSNNTGGAAIGSGHQASCGTITITNGVTNVTATKGNGAINSIGRGSNWNTDLSTCGTVTIGGTEYWGPTSADPSVYEYKNGGDDALTGLVQETYTYNGNGTGSGSSTPIANVIDLGNGSYNIYPGTEVTVKATPVTGYHLESWVPAHSANEQDTAHVTVTTDTSLTANFDTNSYNVTVNVNTLEGSVSGPATVKHFRSGSYTATATPCYHFVNWTNDAGTEVLGTEPTLEVAAVKDTVIRANFALNIYTGDTTASECDQFAWHGVTYTVTPTIAPTFIYKTANNCDSTVTLNLTIRNSNTGTDLQNHCDSYTWIDGNTYTASNSTAQYTLTNAADCDSVVTLNLTVNYQNTGDTTASECDQFAWHGVTYTVTPTIAPTFIYKTINNCDSTVTLNLTIRNSTTGTDLQNHCDSYTWIDGHTYTSSNSTATHTLTNAAGCDSTVTLNLTIRNSNTGTDLQNHCDSYTWIDGHTYTASNSTATHMLTNAAGCDSTVTLNLTIRNSNTGSDLQNHCDSYTWIDGNTYTASNSTATHTLTNAAGCDSVVTLNLTIRNSTTGTDIQNHCDSYTWIDGITYTASNSTAQYTLTNAAGCDSTVTLNLTIRNSTTGTDLQNHCDSYTWIDGHTYTASNSTAKFTLTNAAGCDSTVTLNLTIRNSTTSTDLQNHCDSYTWIDGHTYTASNSTAKFTLTNAAGCDSVVTLNLTVRYSTTGTDLQNHCDSYTWIDGNTYTASNSTAKFTLTNAAGCDSTVTLNLTIRNSNTGTDLQNHCDSYTWIDGHTYTASNSTAKFTLTNAAGCDSVVTLNLTINYSNTGVQTATACDSYIWHGTEYTVSNNTATYTETNAAGCDSTVTLNLTINHRNTGTDLQNHCDNYTWIDGITYIASNSTAQYTLTNAAGCDSVVTLNLTINYSNTGVQTATACDSYIWHGTEYTVSNNTATYTETNAAGCDSTVTLNLTIRNSTTGTDLQNHCDSYTWIDGHTYTASNSTAQYTLANAAGCDSVVTLNLTIRNSTTGTDLQNHCDSYTWIDSHTYTASNSTAKFTLTNAAGCDSTVTLNLTIRNSNTGTDLQNHCDSYTWIDGHTYTASNSTATHTLTNAAGCDSTVTLNLTIRNSNTGTDLQNHCDSYTWIDGHTYTASNSTATHTLTNAAGCDSTVTLNLTIRNSNTGTDLQNHCDSYTWIDNQTYTASNSTATHTLTNAAGCDSTVTLNLTIRNSNTGTDLQNHCDSYTWIDGHTYTASNSTATHTLTNAAGCDSTVTLNLTINHSNTGDTTAVACNSFTWNGQTYTNTPAVAPTKVLTNAQGCDSTVTLHLTIHHSNTGDTTAVACNSFTWNGQTYTNTPAVAPTKVLTNAQGCDSTVTLHLTINHSNTGDTTAVACNSFTWNGQTYTYTPSVAPTKVLTNAQGCDSTVTLHLTINHSNTGDTTAVACNSFTWNGQTYTNTPTVAPTKVLTNAQGCDSTVMLHLTINHSNTGDTTAVACNSFIWNGQTYTNTPTVAPTKVLTNAQGCDSTVTLHLTVNHSNTGDTTAVACNSFTWNGQTYTNTPAVAPTKVLTNAQGCDSTVTLHLTINHSNTGDTTAVACNSFTWNGQTYTNTPTVAPTKVLTNAQGCDSTVTLHLTINHSNTGDTTAVACNSFTWNGTTYTSTPTVAPTKVLTNAQGCDSTVTLHLTINHSNTGDTTAVACNSFTWNGQTYTNTPAVAPTKVLTNAAGCDSTVTLHLTINTPVHTAATEVACETYTWHGTAYTTSGTYTYSHADANNCTQVDTLHLTINNPVHIATTETACESYTWNGTAYTASDNYTYSHADANNCTQVDTLHLTINTPVHAATTETSCETYSWHGSAYTTSGNYTYSHADANGCTQVDTLHLTINNPVHAATTETSCETYSWHGTAYTVSGNYTYSHADANGCTQVDTLHLTINNPMHAATTETACESYTWNGTTYTTSGNYTYSHADANNCTQVDTLHLTINNPVHIATTETACESYTWNGTAYTASGNYTYSHADANGCTQVDTLHLTINNPVHTAATEVACETYTWHGTAYTTSGTYTYSHADANNCTQMDTLHLTIHYGTHDVETETTCESFTWHGTTYTSTGNYTYPYTNSDGCPSVDTLHLTVHYNNSGDTIAVVYEPFTWYEHSTMASTQNVEHVFANQYGCDSTVTLHLRYALFNVNWTGTTTVTYNAQPQSSLGASYVDDTNHTQQVVLTFSNGSDIITSPNYPVNAGVWDVVARPVLSVDSLSNATTTLTILPATVYVSGAEAEIAKYVDGNSDAVVTNQGTLNNIQGNDVLSHTTTAIFNDATVGEGKTLTLTYALIGTEVLLNNYTLNPTTEVYTTSGAILAPITPDTNRVGDDTTVVEEGFDVYAYGYCTGNSYSVRYHLNSGNPDQYKLDFSDSHFTDVDWRDLPIPGAEGSIDIDVPADLPMGNYTVTATFRDSRFPWLESAPITMTFHVNLPETYTLAMFNDVIALVDTCECFTDIQWYHRANSSEEWHAIPGATEHYYREEGGLTGEYFVRAKMNGEETYTCPQSDVQTLADEDLEEVTVTAYPNPTTDQVTVAIEGSTLFVHTLRIINAVGVEVERRTFEGPRTMIDMSRYHRGNYLVTVDGAVVRVIRN